MSDEVLAERLNEFGVLAQQRHPKPDDLLRCLVAASLALAETAMEISPHAGSVILSGIMQIAREQCAVPEGTVLQ